ncbi:unnamed protein product [Dovyalis caffra]|uniref:Uncharacterized protein n=1 Tax=Dovyalis caffra TaxID=77055 RepID=A0AAV1SGU9_9ROSI|nr:unnamed protein product [Dovyalis caffra]
MRKDSGPTECVSDVIARLLKEYSDVESDMVERLHQAIEEDESYKKLASLVRKGIVRRYWLDNDLLYAKEGRIFVLNGKSAKIIDVKDT